MRPIDNVQVGELKRREKGPSKFIKTLSLRLSTALIDMDQKHMKGTNNKIDFVRLIINQLKRLEQ